MRYIWQRPLWPKLTWDEAAVSVPLEEARNARERVIERLSGAAVAERSDLGIAIVTSEIVGSSAIEGVSLQPEDVRSSIVRRLGAADSRRPDRKAEGLAEMSLDATVNPWGAVNDERLFRWHRSLFAGDERADTVGRWRTSERPMQVVSGPVGRERVHYEAPPSARVPEEMSALYAWIKKPHTNDPIVTSAIAHLWFVTIHPFEDGNGRIARTLGDLMLVRRDQQAGRFVSLSHEIAHNRESREEYYAALQSAQQGDEDVSGWICWYANLYSRATQRTLDVHHEIVKARDFWAHHTETPMNERQSISLREYLSGSFKGFINTKKWAAMNGVSQDTAERDLADLLAKGVIVRNPGGSKNTSYDIAPIEREHQKPIAHRERSER